MFRAWRRELIQFFRYDITQAGFEPELCIQCARHKKKVADIPGDEPRRIDGKTTRINKYKAARAILSLIFKEFFAPGKVVQNLSPIELNVKIKSRIAG